MSATLAHTPRSHYHVYAMLLGAEEPLSKLEHTGADNPIARRLLNRIERVAQAYQGKINARYDDSVLVTFKSADSALLGACEMQHRCASLPQVTGQRLALRIGIHQSIVKQRAKDELEDTLSIAACLANADDAIVASSDVVAALTPELRKLTRPINTVFADVSACGVDWRGEIPSGIFTGESSWSSSQFSDFNGPALQIYHGTKLIELNPSNPLLTIGRGAECDLFIREEHVSRTHCRIERQIEAIVLTDTSTNGTCIKKDNGVELMVQNGSTVLQGTGLIFFGRPSGTERRGGLRFEVI